MDNPIISSIADPRYQKRLNWLKGQLTNALEQPLLNFNELMNIKDMGLYLIYDDAELLYIGMTSRVGNLRIDEIARGYRSHTFNRKLLAQHFRGLGHKIDSINPKTFIKLWVETNKISRLDIRSAQREVNSHIRSKLRFRFYESRYINLGFIEHFAIATLQPLYND